MVGIVLSFGASFAAYNLVKSNPEREVKIPKSRKDTLLITIPPIDKELPPVTQEQTKTSMVKMIKNLTPVVTDDNVTDVISTQD